MRNDTRSLQVRHIVQELSALPGGLAVDIVSKKLPRFGPADSESFYQVNTSTFPVGQVPDSVNVPPDTDEIIIRLHGSLERSQARDELVDELYSFFSSPDYHDNWDVRTHFKNGGAARSGYELTVFSNVPPATPEKLA
jgi:hypothetical protein